MKVNKAIQICGTGSGVGKSVITAALCRIFLQDGYKVAPFKSQNMALNSFVTQEGGEMGRAQVFQAQAAGIMPTVDMNPILIKPSSDRNAQIILMGKPAGNMSVYEYKAYKKLVFGKVKKAYARLRDKYEIIVIEGAGSPAEINLKSHDLVNLKIAKMAEAPVILVGDIDKGGVFAWLVGTIQLLTPEERKMIKGFIINKFRGDKRLLMPGVRFLEKYTGIKVLGVVPFYKDINIAEEDSVPQASRKSRVKSPGRINIDVIYLPHISNFTDFDALKNEPDVSLRYVRNAEELTDPDVIILPGTKNTAGDLIQLRKSGLAHKIISIFQSSQSCILVGVCGGFQMLGERIYDREGIESAVSARLKPCPTNRKKGCEGLGLLPIITEILQEKVLRQVKARHISSGNEVTGYEIHHGRTDFVRLHQSSRPLTSPLPGGERKGEGERCGRMQTELKPLFELLYS